MKLHFKSALTENPLRINWLGWHLNHRLDPLDVLRFLPRVAASIMGSSSPSPFRYRFGSYELNPAEGSLSRNGSRVKLQDLPYRLLVMLVERPGEIVTREEVRQRLWPENTFVEFDNSLGVAIRKVRDSLHDDAEMPRYVETIPRRGYRFVAPVTMEGLGEGPGSKAFAELERETVPTSSTVGAGAGAATSRRAARYWVIAALVVVMVGAAVYEFRSFPQHASSNPEANGTPPRMHMRRSVAVLGFRNLRGRPEDNWLSAAFSEMLNTELSAGGGLRLVSGEDVARARSELPLSDEDSLSKSTLQHLRTNPGADVVVVGTYTMLPSDPKRRIRLDVRLQDTAGGETIAEEAVAGDENDLFTLVSDLGGKLRRSLGVATVPEGTAIATRAALPSNEKAARLYAEGRSRLWAFDYSEARALLTKAVAADPDFPLAHAALSDVWWHTGYDAKARMEARRALELSNHLSQEQRLLVEGQYQRTVLEWPKAVETYRSLFQLFPDSLDYGLLFASAQMHVSAADSLQTLAGLRRLPSPLGDDPRIDVTEAAAWINRDFTKARAAANLAIEKATAQGSPVIVSRAYGFLCQQEPSIDASADAVSDCTNAMESSIAAKDPNGEAMMRTDLAALYYLRGNLAESAQMLQQAVKKFRRVGNRDGVATALSNFADTRFSRGDLMEAKRLLEESIPEYQAVDDKEGVVLNLDTLGDVWRQNGKLDRAETAYQQAEVIARKMEDKNATAYVLSGMGDLALDRGDLTLARKRHEEAFALRSQAGEKQTAAETRVGLAEVALEEGHPADAEAAARQCREQFHQEQQKDDEIAASAVLIESLLAQGKISDAQKEIAGTEPLANASLNLFGRLRFSLVSARAVLASNQPEAARGPLKQILAEARGHGFVGLELEALLVLAELEKKTGNTNAAQHQLILLEKEAGAKGFALIARKASAART